MNAQSTLCSHTRKTSVPERANSACRIVLTLFLNWFNGLTTVGVCCNVHLEFGRDGRLDLLQ